LAGNVQVVARSIETSLHKLHELGFDLRAVKSAYGVAPLPTPTPDFAKGIGRTNDAILYGASVTIYVHTDDESVVAVAERVPSCASADFGRPFQEIFKDCGYDFYKIDAGLFSPAEVTIVNQATGNSFRAGGLRSDLIARSFGVPEIAGTSDATLGSRVGDE
jgi:methenyltetrahydromethanopterin cyclohydrolase